MIPAEYVAGCGGWSDKYNRYAPYSFQFEHNADGHVLGAPRDAFWKSGAGSFSLFVVPSLDLVVYKLGGSTEKYDPAATDVRPPQDYEAQDSSRDSWVGQGSGHPFREPASAYSLNRILETVCAACV